jgi:predicted kinase
MTDIIQRLREWPCNKAGELGLMREAADTIESLQQRCAELAGKTCALDSTIELRDRRIAALEAALKAYRATEVHCSCGQIHRLSQWKIEDEATRQALTSTKETEGG